MKLKAFILFVSLGFILFFKVLTNGYVSDDNSQIVDNVLLHSINNVPRFFQGGTFYDTKTGQLHGQYYRPIAATFQTIIISVFGMKAGYLHFFQLSLYIINAFLVYLLLRRFFSEILAILLAVLFLVHPINSEIAAYLADTQDVLFFFFGMLALNFTLYGNSVTSALISYILIFLSLLSKETGILFFIPLFLIRLSVQSEKWKKQIILLCVSTAVILTTYLLIRNAVPLTEGSQKNMLSAVDDSIRLQSSPAILFYYIKTFLYPKDLFFAHLWIVKEINFISFYLPLIVDLLFIAAIMSIGFVYRKKQEFLYYLFFIFWFTIGMLLHLNVFFLLDLTVAERWFYFPFVGLLGLIGMAVSYFPKIKSKYLIIGFALWVMINVLLATRTFQRLPNWKDSYTLYTHDIKVSESPILDNVFGNLLIKNGKTEEGNYYIKKANNEINQWINMSSK